MNELTLKLNNYQAANLRWLLCLVHDNKTSQVRDTGDWCGELRWELEQLMIEHDVLEPPNDQAQGLPPLRGWHNGMKQKDYERDSLATHIERINKVLLSTKIDAVDKLYGSRIGKRNRQWKDSESHRGDSGRPGPSHSAAKAARSSTRRSTSVRFQTPRITYMSRLIRRMIIGSSGADCQSASQRI